jgi:hypothetical protein
MCGCVNITYQITCSFSPLILHFQCDFDIVKIVEYISLAK